MLTSEGQSRVIFIGIDSPTQLRTKVTVEKAATERASLRTGTFSRV